MYLRNFKYGLTAIGLLFFFTQWMFSAVPSRPGAAVADLPSWLYNSPQDTTYNPFTEDKPPVGNPGLTPQETEAINRALAKESDDQLVIVADSVLIDDSVPGHETVIRGDSVFTETGEERIGLLPDSAVLLSDSLVIVTDSLPFAADSIQRDTLSADSTRRGGNFLDDIIFGNNTDSLVYDVRNGFVYIYTEGDITYQNMNLKADYIWMDMNEKLIYANGVPDTAGISTRPIFMEGGQEYEMDTILYNITSGKAKIRGVLTQEGEGILRGSVVKKMPDNTVNIARGTYSTCDHEHPHFYLAMTKAKAIPGKKAVFGPSYLVMEDVPIYFLGLPFGFFPLDNSQRSGFISPTFGETSAKGFFLRDGGYYYAPNDYIDMAILGGYYTLGSWELKQTTHYKVRYKYSGSFNVNYSSDKYGDRGSSDFQDMRNFRVQWSHSQDAKFRPSSSFSASVNFSTSSYNRYSSQNLNDFVTSQTNSSVAYSKNWPGKPFSFSTSMTHSQNNRDSTVTIGFPNASFNVTRIYPFRRSNRLGKEKWYEKVSFTYAGNLTNRATSVKEYDLFTEKMFKDMQNGVDHKIPVSATFNLFNYINITPSLNYNEQWHFRRIDREWDNSSRSVQQDTSYGFWRTYNYSYSVSAQTRMYTMYQFKGERPAVSAIRHVMTPSVGFSMSPDFGQSKYGAYQWYQRDSTGTAYQYSPFENNAYTPGGRGKSASMSFSLANTLEMKVRSESDTSGYKKVSILDNLSFSGSYNFLADSINFSKINVLLRSTLIKNFGINLNMVYSLYQVDENGREINKFLIRQGKLARLESVGTSFGYSFSLGKGAPGAINTGGNYGNNYLNDPIYDGLDPSYMDDPDYDPLADTRAADPNVYRALLSSQYYDFSVPFNFSFNYTINYRNNGVVKTITQTLGFNTSMNLTPKWGITYNGGYDFQAKKMTVGQFVLTRDLHCWQMNFTWIPTGYLKSWAFNISVCSNILRDLKYDKRSSFYDNFYDK